MTSKKLCQMYQLHFELIEEIYQYEHNKKGYDMPYVAKVAIIQGLKNEVEKLRSEIKAQVRKESPKYNDNKEDYHWYIVEIRRNGFRITINEGFTYEGDARERLKEQKKEGAGEFRVYTGKYLRSLDINPDHDSNWSSPSYMLKEE